MVMPWLAVHAEDAPLLLDRALPIQLSLITCRIWLAICRLLPLCPLPCPAALHTPAPLADREARLGSNQLMRQHTRLHETTRFLESRIESYNVHAHSTRLLCAQR